MEARFTVVPVISNAKKTPEMESSSVSRLPSLSYELAAGGVGVSGLREFAPLISSGLGRINAEQASRAHFAFRRNGDLR